MITELQIKWAVYFGLPILVFIILFAYQVYQNKKKEIQKIKSSFGKAASKNYYFEEFQSISRGFNVDDDDVFDIDDITWNDLNLDEIYKTMDSTKSSLGQEALYRILRNTDVSDDELNERERLISFFTDNEDKRVKLSLIYNDFGFSRRMAVADYLNIIKDCDRKSIMPHIMAILLLAASIVYCIAFNAVYGVIAVIAVISLNILSYYKYKSEFADYLICVKQFYSMCACAKSIVKLNIPELDKYNNKLKNSLESFKGINRFAFIMSLGKSGILEFFLEYLRIFTHIDIIKFYFLLDDFKKKNSEIWDFYYTLGYLDALMAVASYRKYLPYWCKPQFINEAEGCTLEVDELFHPLIENPVPNSIKVNNSVLITGSNASGKSTFLRSAGINAVLSQTINTSISKSYRANKFRIYSSMALKDNVLSNESYYMVEIKSLKRIMDASAQENGYPVLCFIDEVLRGTNTIERIAASSQILKKLSCGRTICFAATHDIELTSILENFFDNYHFSESIDEDVKFDYRLLCGRATSRNAIKLLGLLGYDENILYNAFEQAKAFEQSGLWKKLY